MTKRSRMSFPKSISSLLHSELNGLGLANHLREAEIWRLWPEVAGQTVSSRAQPLRINNGTLTVAVSSSPWMQELNFLKGMMIEKLNSRLGGDVVKEIILKAGIVKKPSQEDENEYTPAKKRLTPAQLSLITELSAPITDTETREAFIALMQSGLENES